MRPILGPALDVDASPAFLFQCGDTDLYGVTLDASGANLPQGVTGHRWVLRQQFSLGVHEAMPAPIDPEPVLRGVRADGYFCWRNANTSKPHGTSQ